MVNKHKNTRWLESNFKQYQLKSFKFSCSRGRLKDVQEDGQLLLLGTITKHDYIEVRSLLLNRNKYL